MAGRWPAPAVPITAARTNASATFCARLWKKPAADWTNQTSTNAAEAHPMSGFGVHKRSACFSAHSIKTTLFAARFFCLLGQFIALNVLELLVYLGGEPF